jgi:predicted nucleic acid-binding protein
MDEPHKPALVFTDADLLIAATAAHHDRGLATSERRLAVGLASLGYPGDVRVVELS